MENEVILVRWLEAIRRAYPTLPEVMAVALARGASKNPRVGQPLGQIEAALVDLQKLSLADLTGSEIRAVIAILNKMSECVAELQSAAQRQWSE